MVVSQFLFYQNEQRNLCNSPGGDSLQAVALALSSKGPFPMEALAIDDAMKKLQTVFQLKKQ